MPDPGPVTAIGRALEQWVKLPGRRWISEKNPGYPFLAAPFQALGIIRLAPLFYDALVAAGTGQETSREPHRVSGWARPLCSPRAWRCSMA